MDASTRWETEAMRSAGGGRQTPPRPSARQQTTIKPTTKNWVTLREAETETGIPVNTIRKWIRRTDIDSYLEADGDLVLRMVDLDAVIDRANELGREIVRSETPLDESEPLPEPDPEPEAPANTMIVPIDAWNKMLNQLGNLHEAGQQLAEARERAAKAETEAKFLRIQLGDQRTTVEPTEEVQPDPAEREPEPDPVATTTYWRHLTSGWRNRKR
jgi:hypothetical protein